MPARDRDDPAPDRPEPARDAVLPVSPAEARRLAAESWLQADPARLAEGWERRFVVEGARAADFVRLYESLGFEVVAEPVHADDTAQDCHDCRIVALLDFRMIYTRASRAGVTRTPPTPEEDA